jgi:peptidoglycan hydrolase-like protein with peptidoglycan-binding domain
VLKEETSMTTVRHLSTLMALGALLALSAEATPAAKAQPTNPAPAATGMTGSPTMTPAVTPHIVREVQTFLRNKGDYHLTVDGREGSATRLAVRRWQRDHNLRATGIIDSATLQSMNITS